MILDCNGELFFATHSIETYLGFHQVSGEILILFSVMSIGNMVHLIYRCEFVYLQRIRLTLQQKCFILSEAWPFYK